MDAPRLASDEGSDGWPRASGESPQMFGDYELLEELARGGMGVVYKARQVSLNRIVALKMILSGRFASENDVRRFYQEAEATASLDHSGIVPIYEIGEHDDRHFFTMKLIAGGTLADKLPQLRSDFRALVRLIATTARAVHHAHQRGVLHRDLKPANILLDDDQNPLVSDLGLARQVESDSNITQTGAIVGTPAYMPPEQAAAKKEITTGADIYSLGAILYEGLTGQPPFRGESPVETLVKVLNEEPASPRELDATIDISLELICLKCLAREPDARYASAAALAEDLENWLVGKPVSVRPPSLGSAFTDVLRANLKSALGASLVGVAAGLLLAFCLSNFHTDSEVVKNPPDKIYAQLPREASMGRYLVFDQEGKEKSGAWVLGSLLCTLATMSLVGLAVAALTRPKPGGEAVTIGMVAALMMSTTVFTFIISFWMLAGTHEANRKDIRLISMAALGPKGQADWARRELQKRFPDLQKAPADEQGNTLAWRLYYDGVYAIPGSLMIGILMSASLCLGPCTAGVAYASRLFAENRGYTGFLLRYGEFMLFVTATGFGLSFLLLIPLVASGSFPILMPPIFGFLIVMAIIRYRGKLRFGWRALLYVYFVVCMVVLAVL